MKASTLKTACALALTVSLGGVAHAAGLGTSPSWSYNGSQADGLLGEAIAVADVNGDGFDDLVVGQPDSGASPGVILVFFGGVAGPSVSPSQTLTGPVDFVRNLAAAGDWNGDGFQDIVVGGALSSMAAASIYLGSSSGLASFSAWSVTGFGLVVAGAGDVNGDGYGDILTGDPFTSVGSISNAGKAYLFLGGPSASTTPAWTRNGDTPDALLGDMLNGAGDVNDDGYDDVLISEKGYTEYQQRGNKLVAVHDGRVSLFLGSAAGPAVTPAWVTVGPVNSVYGWAVGSAGDVNGDGFGDMFVSDNQANPKKMNGNKRGTVYVFHGSSSGPSLDASWTVSGDMDDAWLGNDAVAGDFNHDGFSDLAVSAPKRMSPGIQQGRIFAYLGSAGGLATTAAWFVDGGQAGAGSAGFPLASGGVNGDLFDDLLVGAPAFNSGAGRAELYLGQAN